MPFQWRFLILPACFRIYDDDEDNHLNYTQLTAAFSMLLKFYPDNPNMEDVPGFVQMLFDKIGIQKEDKVEYEAIIETAFNKRIFLNFFDQCNPDWWK